MSSVSAIITNGIGWAPSALISLGYRTGTPGGGGTVAPIPPLSTFITNGMGAEPTSLVLFGFLGGKIVPVYPLAAVFEYAQPRLYFESARARQLGMVTVSARPVSPTVFVLEAYLDGHPVTGIATLRGVDANGKIVVDITWPETIQGGEL